MKIEWLDTAIAITPDDVASQGIVYEWVKPDSSHRAYLIDWKARRGYTSQDEIRLTPQTPNLQGVLARFEKEHLHTDDEARYILAGDGIFYIRSRDDRWIRAYVEAGDLVVIPAGTYHRFTLTRSKSMHCIRLFKENPSWEAVYRNQAMSSYNAQ